MAAAVPGAGEVELAEVAPIPAAEEHQEEAKEGRMMISPQMAEGQVPLLKPETKVVVAGTGGYEYEDSESEQGDCNAILTIEPHEPPPRWAQKELEKRLLARRPAWIGWRVLASFYIWIAVPIAFILAFSLQVTSWILLWPIFLCNRRVRYGVLGRIFRMSAIASAFTFNPFWRMKVLERPTDEEFEQALRRSGTDAQPPYLWMCNHLSAADPWVFSRLLWPREMKWVYKSDLRKLPIAGQVLAMSGDHPLRFTKERGGWGTLKHDVAALMDRVVTLARQYNYGTVIFPEGTRSRSGRLQPFKDGFFRLAMEQNIPIVPVVCHNSNALWPMGSGLVGVGTVYGAIGKPMVHREGEGLEEYKRRVRTKMANMLEHMPLYHPEKDSPLPEDWVVERRGQGLTG